MERYGNGKIYRLVGEDGSFYIGSTCKTLSQRLSGHKADSKAKPEQRVYKHFNELGWDNLRIILIQDFPCKSKNELLKREQEEIDKHRSDAMCLNFKNASGYDMERFQKRRNEYAKQYHIENREAHRAAAKVYQEVNKDAIATRRRAYYETYKANLLVENAKKVCCDKCGSEVTKGWLREHKKTAKCQAAKNAPPTTDGLLLHTPGT
jgi:predicted GIY-YIG superfamily endonuclease